jgi:hypothetical protein
VAKNLTTVIEPRGVSGMDSATWLNRLGNELPGWKVWRSDSAPGWNGPVWHAVPAPVGTDVATAACLANRVDADNPIGLRRLARERYAWNDHCESCGVLARECGHRQPEREKTRYRI